MKVSNAPRSRPTSPRRTRLLRGCALLVIGQAAWLLSCATAQNSSNGEDPNEGGGGAGGIDSTASGGEEGLLGNGGTMVYGPYSLVVADPSEETPCRLSADRRYLLVSLKNDGSTLAGPVDVTLRTEETVLQTTMQTPELGPGESVHLQFDRGKVAGFVDNWSFQVEFDGGEAGPGSLTGSCRDLRHRAHDSMGVLQDDYDETTGLFQGAGWWRTANMLETTIDYIRETGNHDYFDRIPNTFNQNSDGNFINDYYDDMGWWALTWIKAYDLTHNETYLDMAKTIFTDMTGGWDDGHCDGGIYWQKSSDTKVAIANELFLTVAARLHLRTPGDSGTSSYLEWAQKTWTWLQNSALLQADHQVIDSIDPDTCEADFEAKFTSNQGVLIGGLVDLWRSTADQDVLDSAIAIADAALDHQIDEDGILIESSCHPTCAGGDDLLFKGIFMRNLAYLYEATGLSRYQQFLVRQSDALWELNRNEANEFGQNWTGPFDSAGPARQSPALDALIGAIRAAQMNHSLFATAEGPDDCGAPHLALDGNAETTKWCVGGDGHAITIDLGRAQEIIGLVLRHAENGHESPDWNTVAYDASISLDAETWTQIVEVTGNTAGLTRHDFPTKTARYVQVYVSDSQPIEDFNALRIYEIEVLGHTRAPLE